MIMNKDTWNSLPPDIQKIFEDNSGPAAAARLGAAADGAMAGAKQAIIGMDKGAGKADIVVLSDAERARWRDALLPVWDKWVEERKAQPSQQMLDDALKMIEQY
jgi:TRAP-type C4-dicarboxylate transport system substrate-binding protein